MHIKNKEQHKHILTKDADARWTYVSELAAKVKRCGEVTDDGCGCKQPDKKMSVIVEIDDLSSYAIEEEKELDMSFSLKCLHNMCSFSKIYKEVELKLHSDSPLYICYSDGELSVKIYLAPQMSEPMMLNNKYIDINIYLYK
jgi:hypothetical protein